MTIPNRAQLSSSLSNARTRIRRRAWPWGEPRAPARTPLLRFALACGLGVTSAVLVSCGSSGKGLIPAADAGPLQSDFEAVASDARAGGGSCASTEAALAQTEHDFNALPATIDSGLRGKLEEGIKNLRERALEMCAQPHSQTTATGTPTTTTSTQATATTPTVTQTTTTQTAPTTPTTTTPGTGGGTPAPSQGEGEAEHHGNGNPDGGEAKGEGKGEGKGGSGGKEADGGGGGAGKGGGN